MKEEWKEYKTRRTQIEISNFGNVRGIVFNSKAFTNNLIKIINGRRCIGSYRNQIFHLVWYLFKGKRPKGYDIHHKDHNKLNDRLDNLELLTREEHARHHLTGRRYHLSEETKHKMSLAKKEYWMKIKCDATE